MAVRNGLSFRSVIQDSNMSISESSLKNATLKFEEELGGAGQA